MNFKEAYQKMLEGKKVRRKGDNGYFYYDENTKYVYHYISEKGFDNSTVNIEMEDALAEDWEVVEEKNKIKVWEPSLGDLYYYINSNGDIKFSFYNTRSIDKRCIGNFFKTDEEADHMVEKLKIIAKLREFTTVDFNDNPTKTKFVICYNSELKEINISTHKYMRELPFNIYFASEEDCQKAINEIGEENLKKYYFDIAEVEEEK